MKALPSVSVTIVDKNVLVRALVDSGCSQTIISKNLAPAFNPYGGRVIAVDGSTVPCGVAVMKVRVSGQMICTLVYLAW